MTPGHAQVAELFSARATIERWLRFEIALARVEADHAIIPAAAADAIAAVGVDDLDLEEIARGAQRSRHAVVPFVRALSRAAGSHGEYVHWGSTSQDVMDVGKVLAVREADILMDSALTRLLTALAELADRHRSTLMPGRTAGQFATPITFGGKVAGWADEVLREMQAFDGVRSIVLTGQLGGTTGQHAVFGSLGPAIRDEVCTRLGLTAPLVTWHTSRDRFVRWAFHCAMVAGALGRIAAEIMNLQRSEIAELAEPFDSLQVGSSAMPHKRNPTITATLMASVSMVEAEFGAALSTWRGLHERDKSQFGVEDEYLPSITTRTLDQIPQLIHVVENLGVDAEAMSRDLDRDGRTVWSEMLLYHVAQTHGRATAHELIRNASGAWRPGRDLPRILAADAAIAPAVIPDVLPDQQTRDRILAAGAAVVDRVLAEIRDHVRGKQ